MGGAVTDGRTTIVVLTALAEERRAVRALLADRCTVRHPAGTRYDVAGLPGTDWQVALTTVGEGNLAAAALTERSIALFAPPAVLFVGIAGRLRSDIRLGDVVVAKRVYAFHGGRDEPDGLRVRPRCWDSPHALLQLAEEVEATRSWIGYLPSAARERPPAVHFAAIAAGEVVLNTNTSALAQHLRLNYNDAAAIETESAGFALAGHLNLSTPALTIRGISDAAGGDKEATDRHGWRITAAVHAAAFAFGFAVQLAVEGNTAFAGGPATAGAADHPTRQVHDQHINVGSGGVAFIVQDGTQHVYNQPAPGDQR